MRILSLAIVVVLVSIGCGDDGPTAPTTPTVSSIVVAQADPTETLFIGQTVQFTATSTLSDGQMQTGQGAWGSDNTSVATVDQNGLVTGVAAGQATIFVDINPRGATLIQVFAAVGGAWVGNAVVIGCVETGAFLGITCVPAFFAVGNIYDLPAMYTQTRASVDAVIDYGGGDGVTTSGTLSTGGELALQDAEILPPIAPFLLMQENWRSRTDTPGQMTGTFDNKATAPSVAGAGSAVVTFRLQDQTLSATGALSVAGADGRLSQSWDQLARSLASAR